MAVEGWVTITVLELLLGCEGEECRKLRNYHYHDLCFLQSLGTRELELRNSTKIDKSFIDSTTLGAQRLS